MAKKIKLDFNIVKAGVETKPYASKGVMIVHSIDEVNQKVIVYSKADLEASSLAEVKKSGVGFASPLLEKLLPGAILKEQDESAELEEILEQESGVDDAVEGSETVNTDSVETNIDEPEEEMATPDVPATVSYTPEQEANLKRVPQLGEETQEYITYLDEIDIKTIKSEAKDYGYSVKGVDGKVIKDVDILRMSIKMQVIDEELGAIGDENDYSEDVIVEEEVIEEKTTAKEIIEEDASDKNQVKEAFDKAAEAIKESVKEDSTPISGGNIGKNISYKEYDGIYEISISNLDHETAKRLASILVSLESTKPVNF